jgi:hypothetical protein
MDLEKNEQLRTEYGQAVLHFPGEPELAVSGKYADWLEEKIHDLRAEISRLTEERDALAAALEKRGPCPNCKGSGVFWFRPENDDGSWGETKQAQCKCGGPVNARILSSRDAAQRKAGAVWALRTAAEGLRNDDLWYIAERLLRIADKIERGEVKP